MKTRFSATRHLFTLGIVAGLTGQPLFAQPVAPAKSQLTLQQCIDLAYQNNITIRQGQLAVQNNTLQVKQARLNLLPVANFQASQSLNGGRSINNTSNQFEQRSINSGNYQINASATLYNGHALQNTIRQNDLTRQASEEELKATRNTVALNVVQAYLNALTATEQLVIARRQADVAQAQLDRTQRLVNAGSAPEANLYDLRATLANNELDIVTAQNSLDLAKVTLLQNMNIPAGPADQNTGFTIAPIEVPDPGLTPYAETVQQLYDAALISLPDAKGADLRVRSAALGVEVARGSLYPTLSVSGNLSSLFSSATQDQRPNGIMTQQTSSTLFIPDGTGGLQPVIVSSAGTDVINVGYFNQLQNNFSRSVSLFLRVPIFGGYVSRNRITTARIAQQTSELDAQNVRLQLRQQIETAYTNMRAGANRYRATQVQVASLEQAFRVAESRFNAGTLGSFEYSIAKTNLDRARASLVQTKYDYVFRIKILDYYQNRPLSF
ncbi:MAG: TolC family protein [Bacteroidetes bacterium]|nr:TolC family protein [Fibrella sp.]